MKWLIITLISLMVLLNNYPSYSESKLSLEMDSLVNAVKELQGKAIMPKSREDYKSLKKDFDANKYLDIFTSLKLKGGYKLNYFLHGDMLGGYPVIMACTPEEFAFINSLEDKPEEMSEPEKFYISQQLNDYAGLNCEKDSAHSDKPQSLSSQDCNGYMKYIIAEDNDKGYLEYVILKIIGSQFCLTGSSNYNDYRVILTGSELKELRRKIELSKSFNKINIGDIDFEPKISQSGNFVKVRLLVYTDWGGIIELIYHIEKGERINVFKIDKKTIMKYDCGRTY